MQDNDSIHIHSHSKITRKHLYHKENPSTLNFSASTSLEAPAPYHEDPSAQFANNPKQAAIQTAIP